MTWHTGLLITLTIALPLVGAVGGYVLGWRKAKGEHRANPRAAHSASQRLDAGTLDRQQAIFIMDKVHEALEHDPGRNPFECAEWPCDHLTAAYANPSGFVVPDEAQGSQGDEHER